MNIAIVGTGYVGLVSGACFSSVGINVTCIDINEKKISDLKSGIIPIYEPGLDKIVKESTSNGTLSFSTSLSDVIDNCDVVFSAVGTPPDEDGSADLKYVLEVAREFGRSIKKYTVLVTKSTVPVGTSRKIKDAILDELDKRGENIEFDVASNPEFLKEGDAINDFMNPDRIVIGTESLKAESVMAKLYKHFIVNNIKVLFMDIASAEMTKYAANSMLATRISFMNDIANLCERVGADAENVRKGIGYDSRIGSKFLNPGCGYGGSCFPKDVKALIHTGIENGYHMNVIEAVELVNEYQKNILYKKLCDEFGILLRKKICVLGLAFKPNTDDMREAPALSLISSLINANAEVHVYDPIAMNECKRRIGDSVKYFDDPYSAASECDAVVIVTEWKEFKELNLSMLKGSMNGNLLIDGRNIYTKKDTESSGFIYKRIG